MVLNNLTANLFKMDLFTWLAWTAFGTYLDFHVHCGYKVGRKLLEDVFDFSRN
jgi:hypothetical protein